MAIAPSRGTGNIRPGSQSCPRNLAVRRPLSSTCRTSMDHTLPATIGSCGVDEDFGRSRGGLTTKFHAVVRERNLVERFFNRIKHYTSRRPDDAGLRQRLRQLSSQRCRFGCATLPTRPFTPFDPHQGKSSTLPISCNYSKVNKYHKQALTCFCGNTPNRGRDFRATQSDPPGCSRCFLPWALSMPTVATQEQERSQTL